MKKTDVVQPVAMASAFAEGVYSATSTNDFEIPAATSTSADDTCVLDDGFLPITSTDLDDGGIAPERKNFNGMFYLSTDQRFYLQNGGFITYNAAVATAIGGYPQDAILDFIDSNGKYKKVRSLIDDNTNNFVSDETLIDGTHWEEIQMGGNSRNIGEIVQSTIPLSDAGLHLLDGSLISGSGSYAAFVNYIADIYNSSLNYFCSEADWQASVTDYGVCGKFVYDSVNNTVRLPKITGFTEGTITPSSLGDLTEAGLPDHYHVIRAARNNIPFSDSEDNQGNQVGNTTFNSGLASESNSIYGNASTVQPQSIKVLYYIVIATSTKTDIEVDIDEIATDLNGKADVDLSNVNDSGTSRGAGWAMPSETYEDLTLGASGTTYTAPANGYVSFSKYAGFGGANISLYCTSTYMTSQLISYGNADALTVWLPVLKGEVFTVSYTATGALGALRFIYAQGSESEAS